LKHVRPPYLNVNSVNILIEYVYTEPLIYDPKGFFVIMLEAESGEIVLHHYLPDNRPGFLMRGH